MLLKESTSKEVLNMPLAGVVMVELSKGNMSDSFPLRAFFVNPVNWKKSMEGFLLDMAATGQPRRGEAVSVTFSDAQLFNDAVTDLGLPVEGDKQRYCYGDAGKQPFIQ